MQHEKGADFSQHTPTESTPVIEKSIIAKREEEILAFWNKEKIFEQSVNKPAPKGDFVFYDGPPFATGLPHFGHLLQSTIKDIIPRYRTMQGYRVERRWGWDCHGLPLENQIEAELGIKTKREIEELGIAKFNETARGAVLRYADDWKKIIPRLGRFVDMENDYKTMDTTYTESVWWAFKNLHSRSLIYEGFKGMLLCPRCGTTLSNFEVAQGYKDIEDIAVYVKLPLEGEVGTSLLVWTTTSWTLPGNAAAAINKDATYVKIEVHGEFLILAKERLGVITDPYTIVSEFPGKELVGKKYTPPFPFYTKKDFKGKNKAWKIYHAAYVSLQDGTGAVHLAPSYGAIDQELAEKEGIPLIHHVNENGRFGYEVEGFADMQVKPKGHHLDADKKIIEALIASNRLYKQETIVHSYPHCWRCDTPLLNYAASSWFVKVSSIKQKLVEENKKVGWVPDHIGTGRFNNLLETAPDWAISRSRYWGAPLPVWRNDKTGKVKVIGSIEELLSNTKRSGNRYIVMRHGEAKSNAEQFIDAGTMTDNRLTQKGKEQVRAAVESLKKEEINLIVVSPILRAKETAQIVLTELGLPDSALMHDERLREVGFGEKSGMPIKEWEVLFTSIADKFDRMPAGVEDYNSIHKRVGEFLFDIERRYKGKNILIVTHASPLWLMREIANRVPLSQIKINRQKEKLPHTSAPEALPFVPFPHNSNFDIDLHRPYIDEVTWGDPINGVWKRVPEVFDCWFESGSMPYAQNHYPFNKDRFNPKRLFGFGAKGYPADFIAEAVDQTRGWFYSMIVLGVALFNRSSYKHVITTGLVLAEDGRKMSKKLKNYPDPMDLISQFGADALRYYMLASPLVRGEDLNFSTRGVDEVVKKLLMRLENVRSFLSLYDTSSSAEKSESVNVLDIWIRTRLAELTQEVTSGFEKYELDVAVRPLGGFIDDLSTWYLRRSRDRFKGDDVEDAHAARETLRMVLLELAKIMAPVMPFYAEYLYRSLKSDSDPISVHLAHWPSHSLEANGKEVLPYMHEVRRIVTEALEARAKNNIKVRQPLSRLTVRGTKLTAGEYTTLIAQEVNVKEVVCEEGGEGLELDLHLTEELKAEGMRRDLGRLIQGLRKEEGFVVSDRPMLTIQTNDEGKHFVQSVEDLLIKETGLKDITLVDAPQDVEVHKDLGFPLKLILSKE